MIGETVPAKAQQRRRSWELFIILESESESVSGGLMLIEHKLFNLEIDFSQMRKIIPKGIVDWMD